MRKGKVLQRMMAALLSAVLITGMVSSAVPMTVLAQEPGEAQESVSGNSAETAEGDITPAEGTEQKPGEGSESKDSEETGAEGPEENAPGQPDGGQETPDASAAEDKGQETPVPGMAGETKPGTVSGNDAETEPVTAPQIMMMAAKPAPQADNIASGEGWALDADGRLTITSDIGMTGWIAIKDSTLNGTPYRLLVTSAEITGVMSIGKDAFFGCENLTGSITLPEGVTSIGENAFNNCPKLTGIKIPEGVTDIGKAAFAGCAGLTGITIPGSVTSIGESAFATCEGLTSITIPDTVTSMGNNMFSGCSGLTSVSLPNNMTGIGDYMFMDCSSLTSITIPQNVTAIGRSAFRGCEGLREITVPGTVTQIGNEAFSECASLESITFLSDTPPTLGNDVFGYDYGSDSHGLGDERCGFVKSGQQGIHVPDGKAETYGNAADKGWSDWADYIADNATPAEKHEHNDVTFTAWDKTDSLPTAAGHYYLTKDVTLVATWNVPGGETSICLNGKTITQTAQNNWAVSIGSESTLRLYDDGDAGKITGEGNRENAGSVSVGDGGIFYMYGGNISGNIGNRPVVCVNQGEFHMSGGKIADNRNDATGSSDDKLGGGVNVLGGTFYMEGGEISGNYQYNGLGGGVFLRRGTVFYMSGGEISGNTNGIYASGCEIHMSGGEVTDNTGTYFGGLCLFDGTIMTAGGNIVITGNTDEDGKAKNLFISSGTFSINPANPLSGSANIGVTTSVAPTKGNPINITGTNSADYSPCFHSDNADYEIKNGDNNEVQLAVKAAADTLPPTGTIEVGSHSWPSFLNGITFHVFFNERKQVTITAADEGGSGVDQTYYYISSKELKEAEVKALGETEWTEGNSFSVNPDRKCIIYAKITDKAGNVTYLSSDGLVFDGTPPAIYYVKDGETYYGNQKSVRVIDTNLESVTVNGQEVTLMHEGIFWMKAADGPQTIVATDKAGNTTTVTVTVKADLHTHTMARVDAKDATCTADGNKAYYHCEGCGKNYEDEAGTAFIEDISVWGNIAALGHDWGEWTVTKPATAAKPGEKERICKRCQQKEAETIPATGGGSDKPGGENKPGSDKPGGEDKPGGSGENNGSGSSGTGQPGVKQEKEGNIQKEVRVEGAAALDAAVETPLSELAEMVLTQAEKQQAASGTNIRIVLEVKDAPAAVSAADKALVESALNSSAAKGYTLGQYLDINLYKVVGNSRSAIAETDRKITITIDVPDSLKNTDGTKTRIFAVIRAHGGKAELLADLDDNADTITIETDRFSTYAIVYKDTAGGNINQDGLSGKPGIVRVSTKSDSRNPGGGKDSEPKTEDRTPIELSATLAMIAGLTYLLLYFADRKHGMTEEIKKELVSRLVAWAKQDGRFRTYLALAAIFALLVYYHSIGKKMCVEWEEVYGD